jgi:hypothetical protein
MLERGALSSRLRSPLLALAAAGVACSSSSSSDSVSPVTAESSASTPPLLTSLAVTSLTLSPPFSATTHDYVMPCQPGANPMTLTTGAVSGATVNVITPTTTVASTGHAISMTLAEDDPVIVQASEGSVTQSYWLRCLPHDFPAFTFADHPDQGTRTPGYYLLGNVFPVTGESGFAMILDNSGTPVWYRRVSTTAGVMNIDWQPNGTLSYVPTLGDYGSDPTASYTEQRFDPWTTTSVQASGGPIDEHELHMLPNGDVMVFSYVITSGVDLTGLGSYGPNENVADCTAEELDPTGALVWSWKASDHIDPVKETTKNGVNVNTVNGVNVVDVYHFNSIDQDASGNVLISSRATSAVFYIDKPSGKILWKMGGTIYGKDGEQILTFANDPEGGIDSQHDARFQANGDVSVFDDHTNLGGKARGIEYAIDTTAGTASMVWQYENTTWSEAMGSFRRYADGSNLISWGLAPDTFVDVTEVNDSGKALLDITYAHDQESTYRAVKVPTDTFDLAELRATAGHP